MRVILSLTGGRRVAVRRLPEPGDARSDDAAAATPPRWTWDDTNRWYPGLLSDGVRVERAHDLRLAHAILRSSALSSETALATAPPGPWDGLAPASPPHPGNPADHPAPATLFDLDELMSARTEPRGHRPGGERDREVGPAGAASYEGRPGGGRDREVGSAGTDSYRGRRGEGRDRDGGGDEGYDAPLSRDTGGERDDGRSTSSSDIDRDGLDPGVELGAQLDAIAASADPARLRLLVAAESAGALAAAEMHHAGLPWSADVHDAILTEALGPRPRPGERPAKLEALVRRIRDALDAPPTLNPDSHPDLLRAMEYAGVGARSLRKWELEKLEHPVIAPLLEYKSLYRLYTANGWSWLDTWAPAGRFRMEYVVGGVVTGRWASTGGGALQLPHSVRRAVVADPGWRFVVADAAQLEPRVLAGLAGDERMAAAGRPGGTGTGAQDGVDMYAGIVAAGVVGTRQEAKIGMLGAMYGGTTGVSGQVMPRLAKAFPQAIDLVERAARAGERGEAVTTRLGRTSPLPGSAWAATQSRAFAEDAGADDASRARSQTRAWGRFTRNFVVQGTAAEWALCWIASLRRRLWALGTVPDDAASLAPAPFATRPHLAFFLHDEVVIHTPEALAADVAAEVRAAADEAGRLLFGDFPVTFPLTVATVESYADAKD